MLLRKFFFSSIMLLFIYSHNANGQNLDSMENVLKHESTDTTTLKKYLKKIDSLTNDQIAIKEIIGNWIINKSNNKTSLPIYAKAHQLLALTNARVSNYEKATDLYNKAISISEKNNFNDVLSLSLNGLGSVYKQLDQKPTATTYYKRGLAVAEKNNFKDGIAINKFELGGTIKVLKVSSDLSTMNKDSLKLKFKYFNEAIKVWETLNDTLRLIKSNIQTGESYANYELFDSAFSKMANAKMYLSNPNFERYFLDYYFTSGKVFVRKATANNNNRADLLEAIDYLKLVYPLAIKYHETNYRMWYYSWMSSSYKRLNDYKTAYDYRTQYDDLDDSITGEENFKQIADVQHKYDKEKKENELLNIKAESKQKSVLNNILLVSGFVLVLLSLLSYLNFQNKQKLQQSQIAQLEKDKQLLAVDAMLKGQEEERSRLAKDLHDGLGGMLSGVKLSFVNMKENMIMDAAGVQSFEASILRLDDTIAELRKVAHNLMPEALVKFGLINALADFCNSMQLSANTKIIFEHLGIERQLGNTADLYIYRIAQELINNALKHAAAKQILVQLTKTTDKVLLTVEDDGIGFNKDILQFAKGIGFVNLRQRVDYFKGTIDIDTNPEQGTSVNIELKA